MGARHLIFKEHKRLKDKNKYLFEDVLPEGNKYSGKTVKDIIEIDPEFLLHNFILNHQSIPRDYALKLREAKYSIRHKDALENGFRRNCENLSSRKGMYAEDVMISKFACENIQSIKMIQGWKNYDLLIFKNNIWKRVQVKYSNTNINVGKYMGIKDMKYYPFEYLAIVNELGNSFLIPYDTIRKYVFFKPYHEDKEKFEKYLWKNNIQVTSFENYDPYKGIEILSK